MRILGLVFAGTSTEHRSQMVSFVGGTLALPRARADAPDGVAADLFELPDGSTFAVASPGGMGDTPRSIGFLVDDLDAAAADLRKAGILVGPISENERDRYLHFRAPDHELYELVERKSNPA
jgi:catechol 2,3-dioxygenase-like lactoylglutathione lyase family enzyme